jgi:hypothetical protein
MNELLLFSSDKITCYLQILKFSYEDLKLPLLSEAHKKLICIKCKVHLLFLKIEVNYSIEYHSINQILLSFYNYYPQ